jgi:hypothetical protein
MKILTKTATLLLLCFSATIAFAQKNEQEKQRIFTKFPSSINISSEKLNNLFSAKAGEVVSVYFDAQFTFSGTVMSNIVKYENLQAVIIKSSASGNPLFQVSRITNSDKSFSFAGRMVSSAAADGYEIKKDKENNYRIQKFEPGTLLQDCSYNVSAITTH